MNITNEDWIEYRNNATKYLKQNSQYATCKAVQYAIDKQMGLALSVLPYFYGETYYCPSCGKYIGSNHSDLQDVNFCSNCGQKIKTMATLQGNEIVRDATKEEQESVNRYIESISKPTDINFFDLLDGKDIKMEDYIRTKADEMINSFKQNCIKKGISFSKENETFMRTGILYGISLASMVLSQLPGDITLPDNE